MSIRLFVVEDEVDVWNSVYALMSEDAPELTSSRFCSYDEATKAFQRDMFDIAIIDLLLIGSAKQGEDLLHYIRSKDDKIPIIVLSGKENQAFPDESGHLRLNGILISRQIKKPIPYWVLLEAIRETINQEEATSNL